MLKSIECCTCTCPCSSVRNVCHEVRPDDVVLVIVRQHAGVDGAERRNTSHVVAVELAGVTFHPELFLFQQQRHRVGRLSAPSCRTQHGGDQGLAVQNDIATGAS